MSFKKIIESYKNIWKNQRKCIKIICMFLSIVLSILFLLNNNLMEYLKDSQLNQKTYVITATGNQNEKSKGNEVRIININIGCNKIDLKSLENGQFKYEDGHLIGDEGSILEIYADSDEKVEITFLKHPWSGFVQVSDGNTKIQEDLYSVSDNTYMYEKQTDIEDILNKNPNATLNINILAILLVSYSIFRILTFVIYAFYIKMKARLVTLFDIFVFCIATFCIILSHIYFMLEVIGSLYAIIIFILIILLFYKSKNSISTNPEYIYVVLSTIIGIVMILCLPPTHILDEPGHFIKAYEASFIGGNSQVDLREGYEYEGYDYIHLPQEMTDMVNEYWESVMDYNYQIQPRKLLKEYTKMVDSNVVSEEIIWFGNTVDLSIVPYIPATFVCFLLRQFTVPPILYFHLTRLVNLIITTLIGYLTIKVTPRFKGIFLIIMTLPITIQQSFGNNMDWLTNSISFLLIALILREIYIENEKKPLKNSCIVRIIVVSIVLSFCKLGYFSIILLVLLIPKERFIDKKHEYYIKIVMILPMFILSIYQYLIVSRSVIGNNVNGYYPVSFLFQEPLKAISIYLNTFLTYGQEQFLRGLVTGFGWYNKYPPQIITALMCTCYIILIATNNEYKYNNIKIRHRLVYFICFGIISVFIYTSLFLGWTKEGLMLIEGLQPRYFIPALMLLSIFLQNNKLQARFNNANFVLSIIISIILVLGIGTIMVGYFI